MYAPNHDSKLHHAKKKRKLPKTAQQSARGSSSSKLNVKEFVHIISIETQDTDGILQF
jgi:hypothetical protein